MDRYVEEMTEELGVDSQGFLGRGGDQAQLGGGDHYPVERTVLEVLVASSGAAYNGHGNGYGGETGAVPRGLGRSRPPGLRSS